MSSEPCPICQVPLRGNPNISPYLKAFECYRCGHFTLSRECYNILKNGGIQLDVIQRGVVSAWIRANPNASINDEIIQKLKVLKPGTVLEKAERFLRHISDCCRLPQETVNLNKIIHTCSQGDAISLNDLSQNGSDFGWLAEVGATNGTELLYLLSEYLIPEGLLRQQTSGFMKVFITPKGWEWLDARARSNRESNIGFVAMWFDKTVEMLFNKGIKPGISAAGYGDLRIDQHEHNNHIDDEIIAGIRRSRFLVADCTGQRQGVYFEAGFALGIGIPVIWTCREDALEAVHFDNRQYNFITWTDGALLDFQKRLTNRIEATIGHGNYAPT